MNTFFPDTSRIVEVTNCYLRPGRAVRRCEPILVPTLPCEGGACYLYGTVLKQDGRYLIWHQSVVSGFGDAVCHSVSRDGIDWERILFNQGFDPGAESQPPANDPSLPHSNPWNRVFPSANNIAATLHNPVLFGPDNGDPYPGLYKLFGFSPDGYVVGFSPDGRHFDFSPHNPVIPLTRYENPVTRKKWINDVGIPFWDARRGRYIGLIKTYVVDEKGRTRRAIGYSESPDLIGWMPVETIWQPDGHTDQLARERGFKWADYYGMPTIPYGDGYLGFLWLFFIDSEIPTGTHLGKIAIYLAYSRDARNWQLVSDEPFLDNPPDGFFGCGTICCASQPVREGDHEKFYFSGFDALHGAWEIGRKPIGPHKPSIGLATLPKNGFCRFWSREGRFVAQLSSDDDRDIYVTFSSDSDGYGAYVELHTGDTFFAGEVREGQRVLLERRGSRDPYLRVVLRNAGVNPL